MKKNKRFLKEHFVLINEIDDLINQASYNRYPYSKFVEQLVFLVKYNIDVDKIYIQILPKFNVDNHSNKLTIASDSKEISSTLNNYIDNNIINKFVLFSEQKEFIFDKKKILITPIVFDIVADNNLVGLIICVDETSKMYSDKDKLFLRVISTRTNNILSNYALYHKIRKNTLKNSGQKVISKNIDYKKQLNVICEVDLLTDCVTEGKTTEKEFCKQVLSVGLRYCNSDFGFMHLGEKSGSGTFYQFNFFYQGFSIANMEEISVLARDKDSSFTMSDIKIQEKNIHILCVPIIILENILGIFILCRFDSKPVFADKDIELAEAICGQADNALSALRTDIIKEKYRIKQFRAQIKAIAHNIKNKITDISNKNELIRRTLKKKPDKAIEYLSKQKKNIINAFRQIEIFQNFTFGKQPVFETCNIKKVTDKAVNNLNELINDKNKKIKICVQIDENIPEIDIAKNLLQEAIEEICRGAIDANNESVISIEIIDKSQNCIEIKIQNTGIPVPEDIRKKIFTDVSSTRIAEKCLDVKWGLGKYSAKIIIEDIHKGSLKLSGKNCFTIKIPFDYRKGIKDETT